MKYPKAGDLQQAMTTHLTDNPAQRNPYEVRSASGLEGVFADPDDAEFYADELRSSGATNVSVIRRTRTRGQAEREAAASNPGPRILREKWGDSSEIVVERHRYGISGWLESKRGGGRHPISFGDKRPETLREAVEEAKKFLNRVYGRSNPAGLTAKGERMYEHIKEGYGDDPRAEEIASRTVMARSRDVKGLRNPPNILPVPGQAINSWDHGEGHLVRICEEIDSNGAYSATIRLLNGRQVTVPLTRTEYDFKPRKLLERRTGFSRHEQFIGAPQPERFPRGTPADFDDADLAPAPAVRRHQVQKHVIRRKR